MGPIKALNGQLVRSHFSAHAGEYDRYADVQKRVVSHLVARLPQDSTFCPPVLDVGTGTGALTEALVDAGVRGPLVVMDLAHGMTRTASERLPQTWPCDGDARALPFQDEAFCAVVSSSVYQWVEDLTAAFAEVARVMRPGGCFGLALFGEQTLCELRDSHRQALKELDPSRTSHVQNFPVLREVQLAMNTAGFELLHVDAIPEVDYHASVAELLRQLKHIGASNAAADRPRGLASRRVMQRMIEIYEENYRCPEGIPATYEVQLVVGRKV